MAMEEELLKTVSAFLDDDGDDSPLMSVVGTLAPYVPALKKAGSAAVKEGLAHMQSQNWVQLDALLYEHMTSEERDELSNIILLNARKEVAEFWERRRDFKQAMAKAVLSIALALV